MSSRHDHSYIRQTSPIEVLQMFGELNRLQAHGLPYPSAPAIVYLSTGVVIGTLLPGATSTGQGKDPGREPQLDR